MRRDDPKSRPLTRRMMLAGLASSVAGAALAAGPTTSLRPVARPKTSAPAAQVTGLRPQARSDAIDLIRAARMEGQVGFVIADAQTGEVLEAVDGEIQCPPASVTKAVTALYAQDKLGVDFAYETAVLATGPVSEGVVLGDFILSGSGDPTLDTDALAGLVGQLAAQGITGITGAFRVWGGALPHIKEIEPGQLDQLSYNPAISGLNLNYNRVFFEWQREGANYTVTMDARSPTLRPVVSMAKMGVVDRRTPIYTYADGGGSDSWTVARRALGQGGSRWLPVRYPALYAGDVFQTLAKDQGLTLPKAVVQDAALVGTPLASVKSQPLRDVLEDMLYYSTNLTAEAAGLTATVAGSGVVDDLATSATGMNIWANDRFGISPAFVDHSGLSDQNQISADEMVRLLSASGIRSGLEPILKVIDMRDNQGRPMRDYPASVRAKTGTLNFVSALSGYLTTAEGRVLSFAIFCADLDARERSKSSMDERPAGAAGFNGRAKNLQQQLLQRWAVLADLSAAPETVEETALSQ